VKHDADRVLAHTYADEVYVKPTYDFYRPTAREQWIDAIGCAAQMAGIVILSVLLWLLGVGVYMVVTA
jgi:hypothetical protein